MLESRRQASPFEFIARNLLSNKAGHSIMMLKDSQPLQDAHTHYYSLTDTYALHSLESWTRKIFDVWQGVQRGNHQAPTESPERGPNQLPRGVRAPDVLMVRGAWVLYVSKQGTRAWLPFLSQSEKVASITHPHSRVLRFGPLASPNFEVGRPSAQVRNARFRLIHAARIEIARCFQQEPALRCYRIFGV